MRPRVAFLLLAATLVAPSAPAQPERVLAWEWTLSLPEPDSGLVHVELRVRGFEGVADAIRFEVGQRALDAHAIEGAAATREGAQLVVALREGAAAIAYDVRPGAHVGRDFALFDAQHAQLAFAYERDARAPVRNETTVRVIAPQGWSAAAAWEPLEGSAFRLPADETRLSGLLALGPFGADETRTLAGRAFRHVRLGNVTSFEPVLWDHLERATPFLAATHGDVLGARVFVVSAPSPMAQAGLAARDSLYVHEGADVRGFARVYALAWQRFLPVEVPPTSALWLREAAADLYAAQSLRVSGQWTDEQVNRVLNDARRHERDPALADATLPQAGVGGPLASFAAGKGLVVLRALDDELRARSGGAVALADVLGALNADVADGQRAERVDNVRLQRRAESLLGAELRAFFDAYVYGARWPDARPFVSEEDLRVSPLRFEPATAAPGDPVVVSFDVLSRGTAPASRALALSVGGRGLGALPMDLPVGASASLRFHFDAPPPGDHVVRVGARSAVFHALLPPQLSIARVGATTDEPGVGEPFALLVYVENAGERPGRARVDVYDAGRLVQRTTEATIDAGTTDALTLPLRFDAPGPRTLELELHAGGATQRRTYEMLVHEPPTQGRATPAGLVPLLAAAVAAMLLARRR